MLLASVRLELSIFREPAASPIASCTGARWLSTCQCPPTFLVSHRSGFRLEGLGLEELNPKAGGHQPLGVPDSGQAHPGPSSSPE